MNDGGQQNDGAVTRGKVSVQSWMQSSETLRVMNALYDEKIGEARFVGGCVRDALANRKVVDIDIATPLPPEVVIEKLAAAKIGYAPTGLKHGTVTAIVDGKPYEITTLRIDVMTFGRHAEVKYTDDWKTDAARRDFTFNAMSATPDGDVYDYFGGIEDLREGRVRFVGEPVRRITEDVLRILRYFRFLAHFGRGVPDADALRACRDMASEITKLSAERIRQEILKLLEADNSPQVWALMLQAGIVTYFLSEATDVKALEHLIVLEKSYDEPPFPLRRMAALLNVTREGVERIADGLRLSNLQREHLRELALPAADVTLDLDPQGVRRAVYRRGNDMVRSLLLLAAARNNTMHNLPMLYSEATTFTPPQFPVTGGDVIDCGWQSGPDVGYVLGALEDWWISKDFQPGRIDCLKMLRSYAGK